MRTLALTTSLFVAVASAAFGGATPTGGAHDIRVRNAIYHPDQVYLIETDLKFATTIHFGRGERFEAVIAGDTESFEITPVTNLGNVVSIKPHVSRAETNMTVITNRRTYSFELREGRISGRTGRFYEVRFQYPEDRRKSSTGAKGYQAPRNYNYGISGEGDFAPGTVYDDGRYTYFSFPEGTRQPAIFKADSDGRERTVNWTQIGNTVRVLGVNEFWTLRIDDDALCIRKDQAALTVGN
ncbi:Type IV secretory pathway, VirB9 component (plasmid) [Phaeobacter piscinae]|uniref:Type IV secretory pathway, VirB9 component n=1 Tax=Phaeobacter piscinae TaxID=1580596 RepID=A0ABN5DM91_9RHOB|nr:MULTISPECIES: TrbG/VirB9 family P-type conjugative transfer protein [Phaeobacter]ATG38091.1 Type IV secretory pathway, VirB9 component [Phaeobacter piscinae]AUQ88612.1 Type IV secretory pathway, VirB9 component [Phaeobacter piscinae]AUQ92601.1 Type IV secretory pathway, VirB9 component [Phaeobacter inhibens]AUR26417.1 Type IV secretory pathway, VirB9 component [Phaeobacter piscinae]